MTLEQDIDQLGGDVATLLASRQLDDDEVHAAHRQLRKLSSQLSDLTPAPPGLHTKIFAITSALLSLFNAHEEHDLRVFKDFYGS